MMRARTPWLLVGAAGVFVSAYVHFYLYFWGGYRGISPDRIAGLDISRSFALSAIAGLVIAEFLVVSVRFERLALPASILGIGFALGALGASVLARTTGLLGFEESSWTVEAVVVTVAEVVAVLVLGRVLALRSTTH